MASFGRSIKHGMTSFGRLAAKGGRGLAKGVHVAGEVLSTVEKGAEIAGKAAKYAAPFAAGAAFL